MTIEKDLPKAYECSHSNCEAALPSRGYHLVTCGKNLVNHHGGVGTCREKYYICQGSCLIHGSGSGSDGGGNGNTPPTGSTPPNNGGGGNSPPPTDNTPNCQDCTSDCSSPCSCTNSGTCNGTVVDNTPNCDQCTDGCWLCMVVCSREDCSSWVLPSAPHSASCDKGHTYWPGCPANKNTWWHQSSTHTEVSCSRSGCSNKWYPCQRYTPKCKVRHGGCSAQ